MKPLPSLLVIVLALLITSWHFLVIPLHGYGTVSFDDGFGEVHIGTSWQEWKELQKRHRVECVCDATDCYVYDLLRTYNVAFRSESGGPLKVYYKRVYVHIPLDRTF